MTRIFFVGQAPSRETDGQSPFVGKCGKFLAELLGTMQEKMLVDHDFINLLDKWPGKGLKGDKFPMREAEVAARVKLEKLKNRVVVLLGANVARAFGFRAFKYGEWYEIRDPLNYARVVVPRVTVIPHPSGVVRYWNIEENRLIVSKFLRNVVHKEN